MASIDNLFKNNNNNISQIIIEYFGNELNDVLNRKNSLSYFTNKVTTYINKKCQMPLDLIDIIIEYSYDINSIFLVEEDKRDNMIYNSISNNSNNIVPYDVTKIISRLTDDICKDCKKIHTNIDCTFDGIKPNSKKSEVICPYRYIYIHKEENYKKYKAQKEALDFALSYNVLHIMSGMQCLAYR